MTKEFDLKSIYLNSAYLGPMPLRAKKNVEAVLARGLDPAFYLYDEWRPIPDQLRERLARLLGTTMDSISINTSVSEVVSHVADGLELREGDEVLLLEGDYPSMVLPWMVRAERNGFQIRFAPLSDFLSVNGLKKHITGRTRLVGCSHVMFNTGIKLPVENIGRLLKEKFDAVLFLTDVSQSFGGLAIKAEHIRNCDVITGVGYKWLLGPYGCAFGYFSKRALEKIRRTHASWLQSPNGQTSENLLKYTTESLPGARKFDRGQTASFLIAAAWAGALDLLGEVGLDKIEDHNLKLADQLRRELPKDYPPVSTDEFHSQIVCIRHLNALELRSRLTKNNIDVSVREGALRISLHLFNTSEQVRRLLSSI